MSPNITVSTTTESPDDVKAAAKHYGYEVDIDVEQDPPKPGDDGKPVEVEPAKVESESKTEVEGDSAEQAEQESDKAKKARKDLLKQVDKLTAKYKTEEGNRKALEGQVAELREQIATLGRKEPPVAEAPPPEAARPDRPKRPKLEAFDYDNTAWEAALDKYDNELLPAYDEARDKWNRTEALRELQEQQTREAEALALEQEKQTWEEVLAGHDGLAAKLQAATDVQISGAMEVVLRTMFTPQSKAIILEHLVDNPDVAAELTEETTAKSKKPTWNDWQYMTANATKLLTKLEINLQKPPDAEKPAVKTETPPPAKPKPVSAAPTPIAPVTARPGSAATIRLDDEQINFADYAAERARQRSGRPRV